MTDNERDLLAAITCLTSAVAEMANALQSHLGTAALEVVRIEIASVHKAVQVLEDRDD